MLNIAFLWCHFANKVDEFNFKEAIIVLATSFGIDYRMYTTEGKALLLVLY